MGPPGDGERVTYVYRAFDAEGQLLYVGISGNWGRRLHQHAERHEFYPRTRRLEVEQFPTRDAALDREREIILRDQPLFNLAGKERSVVAAARPRKARTPANDCVTTTWLARAMGVGKRTIYTLIQLGEVPATRPRSHYRIRREDAVAAIERAKQRAR
jgi:excisionase family DNA binding protein